MSLDLNLFVREIVPKILPSHLIGRHHFCLEAKWLNNSARFNEQSQFIEDSRWPWYLFFKLQFYVTVLVNVLNDRTHRMGSD